MKSNWLRFGPAITAGLLLTSALPPFAARLEAQSCSYSGRGYGAFVKVLNIPNYFGDTGNLPTTGGTLDAFLLNVNSPGTIFANNLTGHADGGSCQANSNASVANLILLQGHPAQLTADVVTSMAHADCDGSTGSSTILNLVFGGIPVTVTGGPNQTVSIPGIATLIINEQIGVGSSDVTVNALHLTLLDGSFEAIIASSHSDVDCLTPTRAATWGKLKALYR